MLRSRLYEHEMRKQMAEQQKLEDSKTDVGWGHQIRSYVLDQSRIKDLRTNVEISNTQKVLDGDLDAFIEASLKQGVSTVGRARLPLRPRRHADRQHAAPPRRVGGVACAARPEPDADAFFAATAGRANDEILAAMFPAATPAERVVMADEKETLYREIAART